jgi:aldose 1-epimerase
MIELRSGSATASIDPVRGGRLGSLTVGRREVIVRPNDDDDRSIYWGSFLMAPWAGRVAGGNLAWNGAQVELPRNDEGHAIHGLVADNAWGVDAMSPCSASLSCRIRPESWPFGATVRQTFELADDHLTIAAELCGNRPMPAAIGWHPWFSRVDDDPRVTLGAAEVLETRGLIPTGRRIAVDAQTDLRDGPPVCERDLDHVYPDAPSPAIARWPDFELAVEFGPPLSTVVVHSREHAFCLEPQTAWPDAVALEANGIPGTGLVALPAGEPLRAEMTLRWRTLEREMPR